MNDPLPPQPRCSPGAKLLAGVVVVAFVAGGWWQFRPRPTATEPTATIADLARVDGRLALRLATNQVFSGWLVEHHADGTPRSRSRIVGGLLDGFSEGWYTNGQIQVREHFSAGIADGSRVKWHPNGATQSVAAVVQGKLQGRFLRWHTDGSLAEEMTLVDGQPEGVSRARTPERLRQGGGPPQGRRGSGTERDLEGRRAACPLRRSRRWRPEPGPQSLTRRCTRPVAASRQPPGAGRNRIPRAALAAAPGLAAASQADGAASPHYRLQDATWDAGGSQPELGKSRGNGSGPKPRRDARREGEGRWRRGCGFPGCSGAPWPGRARGGWGVPGVTNFGPRPPRLRVPRGGANNHGL